MPMSTGRFCRTCDYDLAASEGPVCPECGRAFSPADHRSFLTHPRRTWQGRWRRWRWLLIPLLLLAAAWPRGWVYTRMSRVDPTAGGTVSGSALVIGRPWWLGGWFAPISWGSTTGAAPVVPPLGDDVQMVDSLWRSDSAWLWRSVSQGQGRLSVVGVQLNRPVKQAEWESLIALYVKVCAAESCTATAESDGMSISAPVPPWVSGTMSKRR